eukprot:1149069-Prymnesium_polylepis.2
MGNPPSAFTYPHTPNEGIRRQHPGIPPYPKVTGGFTARACVRCVRARPRTDGARGAGRERAEIMDR